MTNPATTFDFGNKEITIQVVGSTQWEKGENAREYFEIKVEGGKANPVGKLYEITKGGTRDNVIEANGRVFAFEYGFCDSKTKRRAVSEAVKDLVSKIQ